MHACQYAQLAPGYLFLVKSERSRFRQASNSLSEKRRLDKIRERVHSVKFRSNFIAQAVTRLSSVGLASSPETPETPTHEVGRHDNLLILSGTKKRRVSSTADRSLVLQPTLSANRLNSIKQ